MWSYSSPNSDIDMKINFSFGDKISKEATLVTPVIMLHHFPMLLNDDMVKCCVFYNNCAAQLSPWVVLV